jgi:hypothetical protein
MTPAAKLSQSHSTAFRLTGACQSPATCSLARARLTQTAPRLVSTRHSCDETPPVSGVQVAASPGAARPCSTRKDRAAAGTWAAPEPVTAAADQ